MMRIPYLTVQFIDMLYEAIIAYSVRVVRAYVYADERSSQNAVEGRDEYARPTQALPSPIIPVTRQVSPPQHHGVSTTRSQDVSFTHGTVMYVSTIDTPLFAHATISYDDEIVRIPYGSLLLVGEPQGRFYPVAWKEMRGWVLYEDITENASQIFPVLISGTHYSVDNPSTAGIRALIKDPFGLGRSEFPLQAGEYIVYRLWKRGRQIAWPEVRPRTPGNWHNILKGVHGVYMTLNPKAGSIMEYADDDEIGYLAYIEAVFPDESITVTEVNNPDSGIYSERTLTKTEWKELRPVFIEVV
ncbi:MAG TPA: hypothetical protein VFV22_03255 [Candidatus Paceibacterota bacterium]|nr:hypothetical protein [Candidatus Paceibacterota bacterium]